MESYTKNASRFVTNTKTGEAENEIPDISRLITNTSFNTKIGNVEKKKKKKNPDHAKYIPVLNLRNFLVTWWKIEKSKISNKCRSC